MTVQGRFRTVRHRSMQGENSSSKYEVLRTGIMCTIVNVQVYLRCEGARAEILVTAGNAKMCHSKVIRCQATGLIVDSSQPRYNKHSQ